jgi:hypothetical protein
MKTLKSIVYFLKSIFYLSSNKITLHIVAKLSVAKLFSANNLSILSLLEPCRSYGFPYFSHTFTVRISIVVPPKLTINWTSILQKKAMLILTSSTVTPPHIKKNFLLTIKLYLLALNKLLCVNSISYNYSPYHLTTYVKERTVGTGYIPAYQWLFLSCQMHALNSTATSPPMLFP